MNKTEETEVSLLKGSQGAKRRGEKEMTLRELLAELLGRVDEIEGLKTEIMRLRDERDVMRIQRNDEKAKLEKELKMVMPLGQL